MFPVSKLNPKEQLSIDSRHASVSRFLNLPGEIRDRIYTFAIPQGGWKTINDGEFNKTSFVRAIGDPSDFYFPFAKDLSVLRINKQIRREALPVAYRKTTFRLDDIDEFIKVAISIGRIGRGNIESLEFAWENKCDFEYAAQEPHIFEYPSALHALRCVQLLKECKRLKSLHLFRKRFPSEYLEPRLYKGARHSRAFFRVWDLQG